MTADAPMLDRERLRLLLRRRDLAAARHRAALGRELGLADTEMLAVVHLAHYGELTPSRLGALLGLSSGGASALIQRLEGIGHVARRAHPTDRRSALVRLAPAVAARIDRADDALVEDVEQLVSTYDRGEQAAVVEFLERVADASEDLAGPAGPAVAAAAGPARRAIPSLWG